MIDMNIWVAVFGFVVLGLVKFVQGVLANRILEVGERFDEILYDFLLSLRDGVN